jgi:AAA domain
MKLGNVEVQPTISRREKLVMLLWGKPTCGKTVLASTAPGKKLWLQFDPAGTASLARSDNILVADFSGYKPAQLEAFKQGGVMETDLLKLLKENNINTVVVDSLTQFGELALKYGITSGKANRGTFKASIEQPGQTGYGVRSAMVLDFVSMVLRVCADAGTHLIFIAHEQESMDDDGKLNEITLSLGGQGRALIPAKVSEIWHIEDTGKQRNAYLRIHGIKRPMRTRMFLTDERTHFLLPYNQDKAQGDGIAEWYSAWEQAGFNKIPMPR